MKCWRIFKIPRIKIKYFTIQGQELLTASTPPKILCCRRHVNSVQGLPGHRVPGGIF